MSTAYALLLGLVVFLALFIYFVFFTVSLRLEKNENEAEIAVKRKSVPFRWKDLIDPKNKKIGLKSNNLVDTIQKSFYDFAKIRTFGRLKGRRLTKNQILGLDKLHSDMAFDMVKDPDFIKKKIAG